MLIFEPGYVPGTSGNQLTSRPTLTIATCRSYSWAPASKPADTIETIQPNDIAPTLATMLDIQTPSGSSGRVLSEMIMR